MAKPYVIPLITKTNSSGYLMPANTPALVAPDNITHAQLRYSPFSASEVVQGTFISGKNSSIEFSVSDAQLNEPFKLYTSTDGTTYTEDESFGGTNGTTLFNNVANQIGGKVFFGKITQSGTNNPVVTTFINTTGYTLSAARLAAGQYTLTFTGGGASNTWYFSIDRICQDTATTVESFGYVQILRDAVNPVITLDTYQGTIDVETLKIPDSFTSADSLLFNQPFTVIMP